MSFIQAIRFPEILIANERFRFVSRYPIIDEDTALGRYWRIPCNEKEN
jgi:hypothetical protein